MSTTELVVMLSHMIACLGLRTGKQVARIRACFSCASVFLDYIVGALQQFCLGLQLKPV